MRRQVERIQTLYEKRGSNNQLSKVTIFLVKLKVLKISRFFQDRIVDFPCCDNFSREMKG